MVARAHVIGREEIDGGRRARVAPRRRAALRSHRLAAAHHQHAPVEHADLPNQSALRQQRLPTREHKVTHLGVPARGDQVIRLDGVLTDAFESNRSRPHLLGRPPQPLQIRLLSALVA